MPRQKTRNDSALRAEPASPSTRHADQRIYRAIANAIFEQRLPSDTKLAEDSLGDIFSVSRTVVRKALYRLASEKLVDMRPNRGAVVASPSVEQARDVFHARRVIEAATVEAAVPRLTGPRMVADGRERLAKLVDKDHAAHRDSQRRRWIRYSGEFHLQIADIAGNPVLKGFLRELIGQTSLIIGLYEPLQTAVCTFDEHAALLDALTNGDPAAAVAAMTDHLTACEQRLGLEQREQPIDLRAIFNADIESDMDGESL